MAYFSNQDEGDWYEKHYCDKCFHKSEDGCPVMLLHLMWNYDAVGKNADKTKETVLNMLWPRDGVHNAQCAMFVENNSKTETI